MARPPIRERQAPRISVNDLALFMESSDTARMGIIRRSKFPQAPPIIRYRDVRTPVCSFLTDAGRRLNPLVAAEEIFTQRAEDPAESALRQDDARQSIEVLRGIQRMSNRLAGFDFHPAPRDQNTLTLGGVEISVRADLLVYGNSRGVDQIGAAVLRMTQDDADSPAALARRSAVGVNVATLARMHLVQNIQSNRTVSNRLCLSIDIQHGEVFAAPQSNTRRMNDIENACRVIAALWPSITLDGRAAA